MLGDPASEIKAP
jgi:TIR domain